jgi:hypothetical protein
MSAYQPPKISEFDYTKLGLGEPKDMETYGKLIPFTYEGKPYVPYIVMPSMRLSSVKRSKDGKFTMVMSFAGKDDAEKPARAKALSSALQKVREIDEHILKLICKSAETQGYKSGLLTSPKDKYDPKKMREDRYQPIVFSPENDKGDVFPEIVRLKLFFEKDSRGSAFSTMKGKSLIADATGKTIDISPANIESELTRGSQVKPLMRPMSIFVSKLSGKISVSFGFFHGVLLSRGEVSSVNIELDPEESDMVSSVAAVGPSGLSSGLKGMDLASDSEEEDDEEDDEDAQLERGA